MSIATQTIDHATASKLANAIGGQQAQGHQVFIQHGNSMSPEIPAGSIVLVDTSITWHTRDRIYLLNFPGTPGTAFPPSQSLRRVTRQPFPATPCEEYRISLANEAYSSHYVGADQLNIAGLVVGSIRCLTH